MLFTVCILIANAVYFAARAGAGVSRGEPETALPMACGVCFNIAALVALKALP